MSRAVYLVCTDCRESYSDSINRGEAILRAMWKTRDLVHALVSSPLSAEAWEFHVRGPYGEHGDWFAFIAEHTKHSVELRDEYGGRTPIDGNERCETEASR